MIVYFQSIVLKVFGLCTIALYILPIIVVSCWNSAERIASDGNGIPLRTFTSDKQITYSLGAWASEQGNSLMCTKYRGAPFLEGRKKSLAKEKYCET